MTISGILFSVNKSISNSSLCSRFKSYQGVLSTVPSHEFGMNSFSKDLVVALLSLYYQLDPFVYIVIRFSSLDVLNYEFEQLESQEFNLLYLFIS